MDGDGSQQLPVGDGEGISCKGLGYPESDTGSSESPQDHGSLRSGKGAGVPKSG